MAFDYSLDYKTLDFRENPDLYRVGVRNVHTSFLRTIEREAIQYGKPVLLVHGDTHVFRVDKALVGSGDGKPIENVTRL